MPKMNISRSVHINAPSSKVYNTLTDMANWKMWSPWIIAEPEAKIDVKPDNNAYSWEGKRLGSGGMEITKTKENKEVTYDLNFIKPWKSYAAIKFDLEEKNNGTEVTWHMDSSLPWFMFWMKKNMEAFLGSDYERGLLLLKDYVEDGKAHSHLGWNGVKEYPGCTFVGIKRSTSQAEMPSLMQADFERLIAYAMTLDGSKKEESFSQYHKFDFVKKTASYTCGVPVKSAPENLPEGMFVGQLAPTKVYQIEHTGPYAHIGNAWSTGHMMMRNKEFKGSKKYHPFETYGNSPKNTAPNDLISYINFPLK